MVTIGTGPDDPRAWVRAAYLILDAAEGGGPGDTLLSHVQIAATLGISRFTAGRACRELARMGLVRLVPGYGYFPVGGT
jgi:DNA-binding GntR family transcriptional regulator